MIWSLLGGLVGATTIFFVLARTAQRRDAADGMAIAGVLSLAVTLIVGASALVFIAIGGQ